MQCLRECLEKEKRSFSAPKMRRRGWLQGTTETQAELDLRLRDSARSELGLLREEPGLEARGGMRLGGGCGKAGAGAGARTRGPSL